MCTRAHSYGRAGWCGFGGQCVTNGIKPTLAIARTDQCVDIGRMAHVGLGWDTQHGIWVGTGRTVVC
jgi:hypothetical protein